MNSTLPMFQNGFVVRDWRSVAMQWVETLGVGPFYVMEHIEFAECFYRGEPVEPDMSVAIAYSGDHQIELVQQHNNAPSIYTDWLRDHAPGLQHMGTLVDDVDAVIRARGWEKQVVQHGRTSVGQRFAYIDVGLHDGAMIELIGANDQIVKAFEIMKSAASDWDGSRPLR